MTKESKIWLWIALIICILTTILNASEGRFLSVIIAIVSLAGLTLLLFKERKLGFYIMCISNTVSCIYSIITSLGQLAGQNISPIISILMSIIGSMLIPGITFLFIKKNFNNLK